LADLLASGGTRPSRPSSSVTAPVAKAAAAPVKAIESRIPDPGLKDKLLAEIRSGKATFYNTVVAQAQRIDVTNDRVTFVFGQARRLPRGNQRRRRDVGRVPPSAAAMRGGPARSIMNIQAMMKQAQQMQERLKKQMTELRVEATAGGGMVTVVVSGDKQLQSI